MTDSLNALGRRSATGFSLNITEQVREFRADRENDDLVLLDMRRSGSLELSIGGMSVSDNPFLPPPNFPIELERLEGPIRARQIPSAESGSQFRYFLDGTQKTLPVFRVGLIPIVVALSVAGILERNKHGEASLLAGSLRQRQTWVFPLRTGIEELDRIRAWLESRGHSVVDPLEACILPNGEISSAYFSLAQNYGRLIELAQRASSSLRAELETDLIDFWSRDVSPNCPDHWLIVDGKLRRDIPNALGLVKSLQMQHLGGGEAVELFSLPQGHRTSAFRYVTRRDGESVEERPDADEPTHNRTMWYQRFWDATGLDARHALVRIEAPHDISQSDDIDTLASWLMSERLPRATTDPRWPTLLYPIHYLEEILKRRLSALTAGWPS